jgi:hypothetical protein
MTYPWNVLSVQSLCYYLEGNAEELFIAVILQTVCASQKTRRSSAAPVQQGIATVAFGLRILHLDDPSR